MGYLFFPLTEDRPQHLTSQTVAVGLVCSMACLAGKLYLGLGENERIPGDL